MRFAGLLAALALALVGCGSSAVGDPSFNGASAMVRAVNLEFQPVEVTLPAGVPLRLVLDNQDADIPHNVHVSQGTTGYGTSDTVSGPGLAEIRFGPLTAGRYQFECEIHPDMVGTLIIGP